MTQVLANTGIADFPVGRSLWVMENDTSFSKRRRGSWKLPMAWVFTFLRAAQSSPSAGAMVRAGMAVDTGHATAIIFA
jgi:hypothetical protein